ncbi:HAD family hydrolase [Aspergillus clavatus NRRL 1]|uniref:Haloacid dehalogenase-like hydrolase, putative n=1 Tax=Aspergillus clavatus (strain ATCC 1007 / CBS 513.65 / DSM 816 / NCTC 3887 / NRRL 1 / QM 1276 / 107) TaxID=344612 RepID=A1C862_ASPCL|nr:haloacid dehalogenase-like hydrolase, putative [Aspergillus clavatus NRRL 1]EAW14583.1 haloacid dehalogenase-like hydrolase, putative [Aspergillus clavatus NRRL 1]
MTQLVIFDFDGTLFDTHNSIEQTIKQTFTTLLPLHTPPDSSIHRLISSGAGLADTFRSLHPTPETFTPDTETEWISTYRTLYATHGQSLIAAFPGAQKLLCELKNRNILTAIISNKGVAAVKTALERNNLQGLVPEDLIIGDKTPGAARKPDPSAFENVVVPALRSKGVQVDPERVLVVGDTVADILFARNIGARACWCRYGYGDRSACEDLKPGFVVDSLEGVLGLL